uniref:Putative peptidoglycan recognition protein n=1 Tax=Lutzomyia longipalpis TaxID=7200 RepID=A0A1B0GII6_LUTLO
MLFPRYTKLLLLVCLFVFDKIECNHDHCPIILSRRQWRAEGATQVFYQIIPIDKIILIWHDSDTCRVSFECRKVVKNLQLDHIYKFMMPDIAFNFLIDDNGFVYEGTGWYRRGFHTTGHNRNSLGISFIGSNNFGK